MVLTPLGLPLVLLILLHLLSLSQAQPADQVEALITIKDTVGGESTNLTSWNTTSREPCLDKWFGVMCVDNQITALNLSSCLLHGKLRKDAFANLTSLKILDLSKNNLESPLPDFDHLKSLKVLNFSTNNFREPFPTSLMNLTNLVELKLSSCLIQGELPKDAFAKLTSLKKLDFSENNLESPLPDFDKLKSLNVLDFSKNNFREPFPISLLSLTNLVVLSIGNNFLTGDLPDQISKLQMLEELWLGNLTLSGPLPKGLSSLFHLRILSAWEIGLTMELPAEWGVWVNITYINLHGSGLFGNLPSEWGENFTQLRRLDLNDNSLTGGIPESWKRMTSLSEFQLQYNELSGNVPSWLSQLKNAKLDFKCNYFNGTKPTFFTDLTGNCFDGDTRTHQATSACTRNGAGNDKTCEEFFSISGNADGNATGNADGNHKSFPKGAIAGIIIVAIMVSCGILGLVYWARPGASNNRRRRRGDRDKGDWTVPQGVRRFTYKEITKVTKSFDKNCEIGEGGFGKVYMAQLEDGKRVAIKRASDLSFQGTKEFQNEITLLSRLHHRHLVRLEGFCDDKDEQILVYEYLSNGNLHHHLLDKHSSSLNWYRRLEIALAVAQGLDYLHTFADPPIIHRDVKPSNILLDDNMIAKVSDFGISKANPEMDTHVSTRPAGTVGYLDPEYFLRRQVTTASDVYGYGVVLLELITGQLAIDHKRLKDYNLVSWVKPNLVSEGIRGIIDPRLGQNFPAEQYEEVAHLAMACTAFERGDRPTMQTVASTLESILSCLVPPPEHLMPLYSPSLTPLLIGQDSNLQISGAETEPILFAYTGSVVEPR